MTRAHLLAVTAAALLLAGCASAQQSVDPSAMTDAQAPPEQLVIDVTIEGGKVTPTNEQLQAEVN
ncbi:hypothetical protein C6A85_18630, partial [Mycobacterium sp. ITM-2017-0098]